MALINCPECRRRISDMAETCPGCGFPLSKMSDYSNAEIFFDGESESECFVHEPVGRTLIASCHVGETVSVYCKRPKNVLVMIPGGISGMNQANIELIPGQKYKVWINAVGHIRVKRIDE